MLSHQVKDLAGPESKRLKKAVTRDEISKFLDNKSLDEEEKQMEALEEEEEIRGEEELKQKAE